MKFVIALVSLFALVLAAPQSATQQATILRQTQQINTDGYNFDFETSNGIAASEQGQLQDAGTENEAIAARGQFRYTGNDGINYEVTYIADANGFQPSGSHLP